MSSGQAWYALYVKPRHEKAVARMLAGKGFEEFLPLYNRGSGKSARALPLFPGYVFCRFDPPSQPRVLSIPGVFFVVNVARRPEPIPEQEISGVRAVANSGLEARPYPALCDGEDVRVQSGPLRGVEGRLVSVENADSLAVSITLLNRAVIVRIDRSALRRIADSDSARYEVAA
jgi:transcription antitermination factor NusG